MGFAVDTFNDPQEALSNLKAGLYDLLLIDVKMPKMNGFELYHEIEKMTIKQRFASLQHLKYITSH
jgi:DNA-binding response OmpR family regulator